MFIVIAELVVAVLSAFAVGYSFGEGGPIKPIDYWNAILGIAAFTVVVVSIFNLYN